MELKPVSEEWEKPVFYRYTRTFRELKRRSIWKAGRSELGFTRTFMELKLFKIWFYLKIRCVLLVPLWNWNDEYEKKMRKYESFTRTFMELKRRSTPRHVVWNSCFTRTFMELKLIIHDR